MSKSIKLLAMAGFVAILSACSGGSDEEYIAVDPEPISVEPTYTGKLK